ncbi:hypothetical protein B0H16DRAFT_1462231 [Mycena metata]|uniref:Uncharacterized protein n=1 Tax=Mycena metata TaxID=1033252 RepID=A0AAD7IR10_9AGAR|nr:hypothetical protein B0H16DRAFT_1462231 [Mycena metata]
MIYVQPKNTVEPEARQLVPDDSVQYAAVRACAAMVLKHMATSETLHSYLLSFLVQFQQRSAAAKDAFKQKWPELHVPKLSQVVDFLTNTPPDLVLLNPLDMQRELKKGQVAWGAVLKKGDLGARNEVFVPKDLADRLQPITSVRHHLSSISASPLIMVPEQQSPTLQIWWTLIWAISFFHETIHAITKHSSQGEAGRTLEYEYFGFVLEVEWNKGDINVEDRMDRILRILGHNATAKALLAALATDQMDAFAAEEAQVYKSTDKTLGRYRVGGSEQNEEEEEEETKVQAAPLGVGLGITGLDSGCFLLKKDYSAGPWSELSSSKKKERTNREYPRRTQGVSKERMEGRILSPGLNFMHSRTPHNFTAIPQLLASASVLQIVPPLPPACSALTRDPQNITREVDWGAIPLADSVMRRVSWMMRVDKAGRSGRMCIVDVDGEGKDSRTELKSKRSSQTRYLSGWEVGGILLMLGPTKALTIILGAKRSSCSNDPSSKRAPNTDSEPGESGLPAFLIRWPSGVFAPYLKTPGPQREICRVCSASDDYNTLMCGGSECEEMMEQELQPAEGNRDRVALAVLDRSTSRSKDSEVTGALYEVAGALYGVVLKAEQLEAVLVRWAPGQRVRTGELRVNGGAMQENNKKETNKAHRDNTWRTRSAGIYSAVAFAAFGVRAIRRTAQDGARSHPYAICAILPSVSSLISKSAAIPQRSCDTYVPIPRQRPSRGAVRRISSPGERVLTGLRGGGWISRQALGPGRSGRQVGHWRSARGEGRRQEEKDVIVSRLWQHILLAFPGTQRTLKSEEDCEFRVEESNQSVYVGASHFYRELSMAGNL